MLWPSVGFRAQTLHFLLLFSHTRKGFSFPFNLPVTVLSHIQNWKQANHRVLHSFKSFALSPVNPQLNLNTRAHCSSVCTQPSKPEYVSYAQATYPQVHNYLHTWYPNPRSCVCEPTLALSVFLVHQGKHVALLLSLLSSGKFYTYTVAGPPPSPPYVQNSPKQSHSTLICYRPLQVCCRRAMCFRGDVPPRPCLNVTRFSQPNSSSAPPIGMILPWCSEQFITPTIQQLNAGTAQPRHCWVKPWRVDTKLPSQASRHSCPSRLCCYSMKAICHLSATAISYLHDFMVIKNRTRAK